MLILLKLHFFSMSKNQWRVIDTQAYLDNFEGYTLCQMIYRSFTHQDKETEQLRHPVAASMDPEEWIHFLCHIPVNKPHFHCVAL